MYQICVESAEGCLLSSLLCSLLQVCLGKDPRRVEEGELKELKFAMLEELDVSRAQATHESDRARILADIEADHQGDVTWLNDQVKAAIVRSACKQADVAFKFLQRHDPVLAPKASLWAAAKCQNAAEGLEFAEDFKACPPLYWESFQARKRVLGWGLCTWVTLGLWLDLKLRSNSFGYYLRCCIIRNGWEWKCAWKKRGIHAL